jgi:hypothetical protein
MSSVLSSPVPHHPQRGPRALVDLRHRSLIRANTLMLIAFVAAVLLSHFPNSGANPLLIFPALISFWATFETVRCMQRRWSFYHAGVILCVYMDLMAVCTILFFLFYPYTHFPSVTR